MKIGTNFSGSGKKSRSWVWIVLISAILGLQIMFQNMYAQSVTYEIYFGDFHTHTGYSDGQGNPNEAFAMAKNSGKADFMATTDHDFGLSDQEWATTLDDANYYTDENFVAIRAWEWTNGPGHMNLFEIDEWWRGNYPNPKEGYDYLKSYPGVIGQWDHPTWNNQPEFNEFSDWSPENDSLFYLCEMQRTNYYSSYVKALDAGWHVAPANNSDTHSANWIEGYENRTAVHATELTQQAIFDAVKNLRVYGTLDRNLRISYTANGRFMGSMLPQPNNIDFSIQISDPDQGDSGDEITAIEVIVDGGAVAHDTSVSGHNVQWNFSVPSNYTYYFFHIIQQDGDQAWTAPVWSSGGLPDPTPVQSKWMGKSDVQEITVINLKGEIIKSFSGSELHNPDLNGFSSDLYLFRIKGKNGMYMFKKVYRTSL